MSLEFVAADPGSRERASPSPLSDGQIAVRAFRLDCPPETINNWRTHLDSAELERAARFVRDDDRNAYIVAHGILRRVLSGYLGVPAATVALAYGPQGKPMLAEEQANGRKPLHFNLSHASGRALIAVSRSAVGVDLEPERDEVDVHEIARTFFHPVELDTIMAAPADFRRSTFFRYWVAKEAVTKAVGAGLALPLDRFEISFGPADDRASVVSAARELATATWTIRMLPLPTGWHGAVATDNAIARICPIAD